jgi:hypothetical protein
MKNILIASAAGKDDHTRGISDALSHKYNVIRDFGEGFGVAGASFEGEISLCLVPHGNRHFPKHYSRFEYLDAVCDNIWCVLGCPIPEYLIYDREGYSGGSSLARNPDLLDFSTHTTDQAEETFEYLQKHYVKANRSKYKQPEIGGMTEEGYILVTGQLCGDSSITFTNFPLLGAEPHAKCPNYLHTILTALGTLDRFDIPILYKPHPKESLHPGGLNTILNSFIEGGFFKNVSLVNLSIHEIMKRCQGVVTINSGTGFEALLHLKPVATLGRIDYSGMTHSCSTVEDIEKIPAYFKSPPSAEKVKRFIHAYLGRCYRRHGGVRDRNPITSTWMGLVDFLLK